MTIQSINAIYSPSGLDLNDTGRLLVSFCDAIVDSESFHLGQNHLITAIFTRTMAVATIVFLATLDLAISFLEYSARIIFCSCSVENTISNIALKLNQTAQVLFLMICYGKIPINRNVVKNRVSAEPFEDIIKLFYLADNSKDLLEKMRLLKKDNIDPNLRDPNNRSVLHVAINHVLLSSEILKMLLTAGADPNIKDQNQMTPLEYLCIGISPGKPWATCMKIDYHYGAPTGVSSLIERLQILLEAGATPSISNARAMQEFVTIFQSSDKDPAVVTSNFLKWNEIISLHKVDENLIRKYLRPYLMQFIDVKLKRATHDSCDQRSLVANFEALHPIITSYHQSIKSTVDVHLRPVTDIAMNFLTK